MFVTKDAMNEQVRELLNPLVGQSACVTFVKSPYRDDSAGVFSGPIIQVTRNCVVVKARTGCVSVAFTDIYADHVQIEIAECSDIVAKLQTVLADARANLPPRGEMVHFRIRKLTKHPVVFSDEDRYQAPRAIHRTAR